MSNELALFQGTAERLGSSAICVVSGGEKDAATEEIEVGAAVHLALDQLELVDLTFRLTAAPR
jgi:hypothetical protein